MATYFGWTDRGLFMALKEYFQALGAPTNFFVALVAKKNQKNVDNAAATNEGGGKVGIPVTAHGYGARAAVFISGTVNYNGRFLVDSTSTANKVIITATFVAETFTGAELIHEAPGPITNTMNDLTEIAAGNGYTSGGFSLTPGATDFDVISENDTLFKALVQVKNVVFTASGGSLPASGNGARYAVLTDDTGPYVSNRQVIAAWSLASDRTISDTQTLTLVDCELDLFGEV